MIKRRYRANKRSYFVGEQTMGEIRNIDAIKYVDGFENSIDLIILDPDYQDWSEMIEKGLIEKSVRALKETGNILCFTKQPFDYELRIAVNPWFRREIIWSFENGGAWVSKKMPLVSFQKIYWLTKTDQFYFNPRTGVEYSDNTKDFKRANKVFGGWKDEGKQFSKSEDGIWLRDHLHYNKPSCGEIPQKPDQLIKIFMQCFCPKKGTVLDLFSGSGVVPKVADEMGNNYYASELDEKRCADIQEKLKDRQFSIWDFVE